MFKNLPVICILAFGLLVSACTEQPAPTEAAMPSGAQTALLTTFDMSSGKVMQLAEALSEEQYSWRPAEGIRSVKEATMHVAAANYFFATMLGVDVPEGINPQTLEQDIQTKEDAVATLQASIDHVRAAVEGTPAENLSNEIDMFGNEATVFAAMLLINDHMSEHLGQMIAYARSNDVAPPWSN